MFQTKMLFHVDKTIKMQLTPELYFQKYLVVICIYIILCFSSENKVYFIEFLRCNSCLKVINEPPRGKTNNVVSEQVQHKSGCTVTETG